MRATFAVEKLKSAADAVLFRVEAAEQQTDDQTQEMATVCMRSINVKLTIQIDILCHMTPFLTSETLTILPHQLG